MAGEEISYYPTAATTGVANIYGAVYSTPEGNINIANIYGKLQGNINVIPPVLTKGTQGATGFSTQDLKDAARTTIIFSGVGLSSGATGVETALTLVKSSGTGATSSAASFVITNGKTFRITHIILGTKGNATATAQETVFNFRLNTAGAVTTSSTPILLSGRCATVGTSGQYDRTSIPIPDGFEIAGNGTIQIGITASSTYITNAPTLDICVIGFEY